MTEPYFANHFMPELLPEDGLPVMVRAAGEDTEQEPVARENGYPAYHAMLSVCGTGILETAAGSYEVSQCHVFLLAPNQPHRYWPKSGKWHTCWVVFHGTEANEIVAALKLKMGIPFPLPDAGVFEQLYRNICACAQENSIKAIYEASAHCYALLTALSQEMNAQNGGPLAEDTASRIAPALAWVHEHYAEDVSLERLAACVGVSPQHLCKLFQAALGRSPCAYLTQYRIKKAKELLMKRAMPAKAAGLLCGFRDPSHFSAVFKRQTGYTPRNFQKVFVGMV